MRGNTRNEDLPSSSIVVLTDIDGVERRFKLWCGGRNGKWQGFLIGSGNAVRDTYVYLRDGDSIEVVPLTDAEKLKRIEKMVAYTASPYATVSDIKMILEQ